MPLVGLRVIDDFPILLFNFCPSHSATNAQILMRIVALTPSMKKFL